MSSTNQKRPVGEKKKPMPVQGDLPPRPDVTWADDVDPEAWHVDSSLPASEVLTGFPTPAEEIEERDPVPEVEEVVPEALSEPDPVEDGRRRSKTIARKQMLRERRRMIAQGTLPEILEYERPGTRAECRGDKRPCLYVSCRYHLYLDVNPITGSIKINFPDKEVWELSETCALDVAERGGITLEEVGEIMNLTRERIRQVEVSGLDKLREEDADLETFLDGKELGPGPQEEPEP